MSTKEQLETALKAAMKSGDELGKRTLRMTLSSIRFIEIEKRKSLDENQVQAVLQKEVKSRQEAIAEAKRANRPELETAAQDEIGVLEAFMPKHLSNQELEMLARQAIEEVGATSPQEMGKVMKTLMPLLQGRATGDHSRNTQGRQPW